MGERGSKKKIYCYETDTLYNSGAEAARTLGCSTSSVSYACSGKIRTAGGYHVCFEQDKEKLQEGQDDRFKQYDPRKPLHAKNLKTGEELYFESRNDASRNLGIPVCGISSVVNGHWDQSHGWTFWED